MFKQFALVVILICCISGTSKAQTPLSEDGNLFKLASGYNIEGIPVYVAYEMGILPNFTFGIEGSFRSYAEKTDSVTQNHNIIGISFYSNYYFNEILKLPAEKYFVYGGLNLGYHKWFSPEHYFEPGKSSSTLGIGAQIGGIMFFDKWGINLEVSGGTENAGAKLGVAYRFDY